MAVGTVIGRVSVKVIPDTDDFRRDAQRKLDAVEKTLDKVEVEAKLDASGLSRDVLNTIRTINARNRALDNRKIRFHAMISTDGMRNAVLDARRRLQNRANDLRINFKADIVDGEVKVKGNLDRASLDKIEHDLKDWADDISPIIVTVRPDLLQGTMAAITARLRVLTRPREVQVRPVLDHTAVGRVAAGLAALSGARVISNYIRELANQLKNLDKNIPLIGTIALAMANLGSWTLAAVSNMFALSYALAAIGPAALPIAGALGGIAIGLAATVAVLKDFNTQIPGVPEFFKALQDQMSEVFWATAVEPIRHLVNTLLPQLGAGLKATAVSLAVYFGGLATSLTGAFDGALAGMFGDLNESIQIAATGTDALAASIRILGELGAGYLPRLAQWFVDISTAFAKFLALNQGNGNLVAWVDEAIVALADLGRVLSNLGGIFLGLGRAAEAAGGSTLSILADTLERIHRTVDSPAFQTILTGVFAAAHEAMNRIATISGPAVEKFFQTLGTTLQTILPIAGSALGTLAEAIATSLADPRFMGGLISMFDGLRLAIVGLAPAIGPVGVALGALMQVIGVFAAQLGPTIQVAFTALANALAVIAPALIPVIEALGGGLMQAFQALSPVVQQVAQALAQLIGGGLVPALQAAIAGLLPVVQQLAPVLGDILVSAFQALTPILPVIGQALTQVGAVLGKYFVEQGPKVGAMMVSLVNSFGQLLIAVMPLLPVIVELAVAFAPLLLVVTQLAVALLPVLVQVLTAVVAVLTPIVSIVAVIVNWLVGALVPGIELASNALVDGLGNAIEAVVGMFNGALTLLRGVWNTFAGLFTGDWSQLWTGLTQIVSGAWAIIASLVQLALASVWRYLENWFNQLRGGWSGFWDGVKSLVSNGWSSITNAFSAGGNAVKNAAVNAWSAAKAAFSDGVSAVVNVVQGLPGKITAALGNLGGLLVGAGKALIQGLINGISSMIGAVQDRLNQLTSMIPDWKGPASTDRTLLFDAGQLVIDGFIRGLESRYAAVRASLSGLTNEIGGMTVEAPAVRAGQVSAQLQQAMASLDHEGGGSGKTLNYYAASGSSLGTEEDLFTAAGRARMVGW